MVSFYRCELCGNIVGLIKNGGGQVGLLWSTYGEA